MGSFWIMTPWHPVSHITYPSVQKPTQQRGIRHVYTQLYNFHRQQLTEYNDKENTVTVTSEHYSTWKHKSRKVKTMLIKGPTWCNSMQTFIHCKVTLHVSRVTVPIIRSTKNCNRYLWYRSYNTGAATFIQRGLIRTTLEESSCTSIMTYTGGSGYSF